jgi:serine/threonine-protein kinase
MRSALTGVVVIGVGFLGGWAVATRVLFPAPPPPGDLVEVPDVRGRSEEQAGGLLEGAGLALVGIEVLRHPEVDSGRVVGQAPLAGQLARPGTAVRITVSLGPERRPVPEVQRLRAGGALAVLEATGFTVDVDSVESGAPRGSVVEIDPAPGTEVALPGEIRIVVSLGPPTVEMPTVLGMTEAAARDTLAALGLVVGTVEEVFRFGRDQGLVVEQAPPAGSQVERGWAVSLSVGRRSGGDPPAGPVVPSAPGGNNEPREP